MALLILVDRRNLLARATEGNLLVGFMLLVLFVRRLDFVKLLVSRLIGRSVFIVLVEQLVQTFSLARHQFIFFVNFLVVYNFLFYFILAQLLVVRQRLVLDALLVALNRCFFMDRLFNCLVFLDGLT